MFLDVLIISDVLYCILVFEWSLNGLDGVCMFLPSFGIAKNISPRASFVPDAVQDDQVTTMHIIDWHLGS